MSYGLSAWRLVAVAAALAAGASAPALAQQSQTLTFQQGVNGYTGTQDAIVRSNETATGSGQSSSGDSRGRNFGALDFMSIDGDDGSPGSKPNQGLIRFDNVFGSGAGQIKASDTIVSATLSLEVFDVGSGMTVHDLLVDWSQGTVTWNSLVNGIQLNNVEASSTALASFGANNSSGNVAVGTLNIDVTSSLQGMQAGTLPGFGWALMPFASGTNGIDIHASEYAIAHVRPLLTVQVAAVPEPEALGLLLAGLGVVGMVARRRAGRASQA